MVCVKVTRCHQCYLFYPLI
uniref:Uncharacterized protein n=1 Tax=Arundo donax TaxID=35708 RepID=A0A0A9FFD1_ARUDO